MADEEPIKPGHPITFKSQSLKELFDDKLKSEVEKKAKVIFLSDFFENDDWKSMEVRGTGLCLFYSYEAADKEEYEGSVDDDVLERFSQMVVDGIENYYRARKQHEDLKINVPDILTRFDDIDLNFTPASDSRPKPDVSATQEQKEEWEEWNKRHEDELKRETENLVNIKKVNFTTEKNNLKQRIIKSLNSKYFNNSPQDMPLFLAYAKKRNILYFDYDRGTLNFLFLPCYADVIADVNDKPIYPYENNTTILFNKGGHFFPLFHKDDTIKKKTIDLFKKIIVHQPFTYESTSDDFKNNNIPKITFKVAIQEAKEAIAAAEPGPEPAEPPAAAPAAVEPGPAAEEPPAAEPAAEEPAAAEKEKTPVQTLLKKNMIDFFRERNERNERKKIKKREEGGE